MKATAAFGVMKMAFGAMGLTMDKITFGDAVVKGDEAVVNYTVTGVPNVSGGFVQLRKVVVTVSENVRTTLPLL